MSGDSPDPLADSGKISWLWLLAPAGHVLGLLLFLDWREILTNPPVVDTDRAAYWAGVWAVSHFLDLGRLWGYDPFFMAGWPAGALFNVDNKLVELASWALSRTGLSLPLSYNLVLASLVTLTPLSCYPAGRWLGLGRAEALLAQWAGLGLWYLDPAFRWAWQGGTLAFVVVVYLGLLVLAAAVRLAGTEAGRGTPLAPWLAWFGLGPLLFWLHALAFALLLLPLSLLAWQSWPRLAWPGRLIFLLWPPLVILLNLPWLLPALRFAWSNAGSHVFLQGGLPALAADLLGIGYVDGAARPGLLGLRWLVLLVGGLGLWGLARRDYTSRAVAIGLCQGLLLAYGAVHLPGGAQLQPYRYIQQAALWSVVGLGPGLGLLWPWLWPENGKRGSVKWRRGLALGLAVAAMVWIGKAAWQYRPPALGGAESSHRWQGPSAEASQLCRHLAGLPAGSGRVLVEDWRLGAILPWCSGVEVIGGPFGWVWLQYGYSNANLWDFLEVPYRDYSAPAWQAALATYDIQWIVASQAGGPSCCETLAGWLAAHPDQAAAGPTFGSYRLYRANTTRRRIEVKAGFDRLAVVDTPPEASFVLPYHWLPTLRAEPGSVQLEPEWIGADPIPFIRVRPGGVGQFMICNEGCE